MNRISLAAAAVVIAMALTPGAAYAASSPGGQGGQGGSGGSGGSSGTSGSSGSNGTSNANCLGMIRIVFSWFGNAGTNSQCQQH